MGTLHELWERYRDRVGFVVIYIREAHPEDGWVVEFNRAEGIALTDPATYDERAGVAAACALRLQIRMPVVVDDMDDRVASAYGALPDRLYLISRGGRIAYQSGPGPFGFLPHELEAAIETELAGR